MSKELLLGVEDAVTLGSTINRITGDAVKYGSTLLIFESDVGVYVVAGDDADGAALPSTGRELYASSVMPVEIDLSSFGGQLALAGDASGSCRAKIV